MHAVLQMSAGGPYSAPIRTSTARYCLVWMSSVKCLCCEKGIPGEALPACRASPSHPQPSGYPSESDRHPNTMLGCPVHTTQQALPRSAILILILSAFWGSRGFTRRFEAPNGAEEG